MKQKLSAFRGFQLIGLIIFLTITFFIDPTHVCYAVVPIIAFVGVMYALKTSVYYQWVADIRAFTQIWKKSANSTVVEDTSAGKLRHDLRDDSDFWEKPSVYTVLLPRDTDWKADQAVALVRQLSLYGDLALCISATNSQVMWHIVDLNAHENIRREMIVGAVKAAYINAEVSDPVPYQLAPFKQSFSRYVALFSFANIFPVPLPYAQNLPKVDPLVTLVNAASGVREGESVYYYLYLPQSRLDLYETGMDYVTHSHLRSGAIRGMEGSNSLTETLVGAAIGATFAEVIKGKREPKYPADEMRLMEEKLQSGPLMWCMFGLEANSPDPERIASLVSFAALELMGGEYQGFNEIKSSSEVITVESEIEHRRTNILMRLVGYKPLLNNPKAPEHDLVMNHQEIAAIWHLPHKGFEAPEIVWQKGKQVAAPPAFRGIKVGVKLGMNKPTGSEIYQPVNERVVHTLVIGKTGTGKTSFMQALASQDIVAGNGLAVIDPVGGLVRRILQHDIPPERENDVVVLDMGFEFNQGDKKGLYPVPLNPLAKSKGVNRQSSAGEFAAILGKLYEDIGQTRWVQALQAALELLSAEDKPTLYDIWTVIDDRNYRNRLLSQFDFNVHRKWEMLERGGALSDTSIQSVLWRLNQFLDYDLVRTSTCHPNKFDFYSLIQENKIILVSVHADESVVPKSAQNVLGAIVISQIQMAAMGGAVRDPKNKPFMLYVDEVQNFVTSSLDDLARQARQKGLGLVVATQTTSSIAPRTLKALEGNIGTLVAFECSEDDAKSALPLMPGLSVPNLMNMGRFKTVVSIRSEGGSSRAAFSVDPVAGCDISTNDAVIQRELDLRKKSVDTYTPMTYDEVNTWLNDRYNNKPSSPKPDDEGSFGNPIT